MKPRQKASWFFAVWAMCAVLCGAVLMSFHQPFLAPDRSLLSLASGGVRKGRWRAVHVLSLDCACSARVMRHLLERPTLRGADEEMLLIESTGAPLPGSEELARALEAHGMGVQRLDASEIPARFGLRGVPLLMIASPTGEVVYLGGYGPHEDQDEPLFERALAGRPTRALPIVGCAAGRAVMRQADPLGLKYDVRTEFQRQGGGR